MLHDIKQVLEHTGTTLWQDALGALALLVLLLGALHLPGLI